MIPSWNLASRRSAKMVRGTVGLDGTAARLGLKPLSGGCWNGDAADGKDAGDFRGSPLHEFQTCDHLTRVGSAAEIKVRLVKAESWRYRLVGQRNGALAARQSLDRRPAGGACRAAISPIGRKERCGCPRRAVRVMDPHRAVGSPASRVGEHKKLGTCCRPGEHQHVSPLGSGQPQRVGPRVEVGARTARRDQAG